jgi:hypothetical protein
MRGVGVNISSWYKPVEESFLTPAFLFTLKPLKFFGRRRDCVDHDRPCGEMPGVS